MTRAQIIVDLKNLIGPGIEVDDGGLATGIDRIDNSKGYIDGNMQPCCGVCNHMKWNLTHEQFISKCKQIVTCVGYEI